MKKTLTYILSFIGFCGLIFADQFTKFLSVKYLKDSEGIAIIKGVLEFTYVQNIGAAWGMLGGKQTFFIILTSIMLLVMFYVIIKTPLRRKYNSFRITMICLAAGAAGNLIDRIKQGYVDDFIYFKIIDFPVFNVADICVCVSMAVLIILLLFKFKKDGDFDFLKPNTNNKNVKEPIKDETDGEQ